MHHPCLRCIVTRTSLRDGFNDTQARRTLDELDASHANEQHSDSAKFQRSITADWDAKELYRRAVVDYFANIIAGKEPTGSRPVWSVDIPVLRVQLAKSGELNKGKGDR